MIKIKLSTSFPEWPLIHQTPGAKGVWGNCQFVIDQPNHECDWWAVYDGLVMPETNLCPQENTIFISGEPPSYRRYERNFLRQFSTIITSHRLFLHKNVIHKQQALPWHIGVKRPQNSVICGYDDLAKMKSIPKSKLLSTIISSKSLTEGHRERLRFLEALKSHFGDRIEIFGMGINEIDEKWQAVAPFRYHIVMENSRYSHYFTEKLADTYLAGAYPFYYGCPNLSDYFPTKAFTAIDINQPRRAIEAIERGIAADLYSLNQADLSRARELTLNRYNLFPMLAEICRSPATNKKRNITLYPEGFVPL